MSGRRAKSLNEKSRRQKRAKRELKHRHRFVQFEATMTEDEYYKDMLTGKEFPGEMPKVLRAFRITEYPTDQERADG